MPSYLWATEESTPRRIALAPLLLGEGAYRFGTYLHRKVYDLGLRRRFELDPRVISVGNLGVGGSGKTPTVGWLARELYARGRKVAILSRGVSGKRIGEVNVVSDGERVLMAPRDVGDEPVMLAGRVPGVPVLAGRNRVALGMRASAAFGAEVVILDDGFQHYRLRRDLDLVCIDARLGLGNGHVLPRGPLREPASALARAHAVIWTRAEEGEAPRSADQIPDGLPQFPISIRPRQLRNMETREVVLLDKLRGQRVGVLAAIARPERLEAVLESCGASVVQTRFFADHHRYKRRDLHGLDLSLVWVTTEKDAVKIPPSWAPAGMLTLEEQVRAPEGPGLVDFVIEKLDSDDEARS